MTSCSIQRRSLRDIPIQQTQSGCALKPKAQKKAALRRESPRSVLFAAPGILLSHNVRITTQILQIFLEETLICHSKVPSTFLTESQVMPERTECAGV